MESIELFSLGTSFPGCNPVSLSTPLGLAMQINDLIIWTVGNYIVFTTALMKVSQACKFYYLRLRPAPSNAKSALEGAGHETSAVDDATQRNLAFMYVIVTLEESRASVKFR